jgi:hypothetical protein
MDNSDSTGEEKVSPTTEYLDTTWSMFGIRD